MGNKAMCCDAAGNQAAIDHRRNHSLKVQRKNDA